MTTEPSALAANLARIETLSRRIQTALARLPATDPALAMPVPRMAELWEAWLASDPAEGTDAPDDPAWAAPPYAALHRQHRADAARLRGLAPVDTPLGWLARQVAAMTSPANALATNPEAQARATATGGGSLVQGMEHLLADMEASDLPQVPLSAGFEPGRDLATTPGEVVLRTEVMELIRYVPQTDTVFARPLLIVPPWINRFYILDLRPENSLVRWLVGQGMTVFMISWRDPGPAQRDQGLEAHVEAVAQAARAARDLTGADRIGTAGYCLGGTALVLALAAMARQGEEVAASVTLLATLLDFSDPGGPGVYLSADTVAALRREAEAEGILDRAWIGRGFALLRPEALVWRPAVRRYLLGESPPRHDLLFWNGDGTNLSARMVRDLLETLYRDNGLMAGLSVMGQTVTPADLKLPVYAVACARDHIATAEACRTGFDALPGPRTFVLSEAGHVAGIVNPPGAGRYGFTVDGGARQDGSWWPNWGDWLAQRSGARVVAKAVAPALGPAPGLYVRNALPSDVPVIDQSLRQKRAGQPKGSPPMSLFSDTRSSEPSGGGASFSDAGPLPSRDSGGKGARMADTDKPLLIKRYASRRLYNTETSDYVTLDDIARVIQSGRDVKIVDLKSGDDLTRQYLLQIIAEHEAKGENVLPMGVLNDLIRSYTGQTESVVPQLLAASFEMVQQHQAQVMENLSTAGFGQVPGFEALRKQQEVFMRSMLRGWGAEPKAEPAEPDLADIRRQLAELQDKLARL